MSVCEGCLSSGRSLSHVPLALQCNLAALRIHDTPQGTSNDYIGNMYICWECAALLKKILQFKLRATRAQECLQWAHSQGDSDIAKSITSLSSLCLKTLPIININNSTEDDSELVGTDIETESCDLKLVKSESYPDSDTEHTSAAKQLQHRGRGSKETYKEDNLMFEIELGNPTTSKVARQSKRYGQMYTKLKLSGSEVRRMRDEARREGGFVNAPLKCETCITPFRCETMLNKHRATLHSEVLPNACKICCKRFSSKAERDRHLKGHYFCYKCNKCDLIFLERDAACRHYKKDEHCCKGKSDERSNVLKSKEYIKHPSIHKDYRCHICNKMFTFKGYFKKHLLNHESKPQYQCHICSKRFGKKACLNVHMLTHSDEKPHQCNICKKQFSRKPNLKQHMSVHTLERQHQCEICSRCFSQRGTLKQHMVTHTGEKAHQCEICSKCFTLKTGLKRHMLYHTGQLPFRCDICNKGFPVKYNLEQHMLTHTGEKPYQCSVCNKRFPLKATLKQHMILHSFDPRNQCGICKKCFTQAKSLRLHMAIHTGERPYGCQVCGKYFSYAHTLQQHVLTHTGEQPYGCDICSKRFALKANLKKHTAKFHEVEQIIQVASEITTT